jgi:hypothetical protein
MDLIDDEADDEVDEEAQQEEEDNSMFDVGTGMSRSDLKKVCVCVQRYTVFVRWIRALG